MNWQQQEAMLGRQPWPKSDAMRNYLTERARWERLEDNAVAYVEAALELFGHSRRFLSIVYSNRLLMGAWRVLKTGETWAGATP